MKNILYLFLFILISCNSDDENDSSTSNEEKSTPDSTLTEEEVIEEEIVEFEIIQEFTDVPNKIKDIELTYDQEVVEIITDRITDIELEVILESSITIMDEGPHCDLVNWHHGYTDWIQLDNNLQFTIEDDGKVSFDFNEYWKIELNFPNVSMKEVRAYTETECGERWSTHIKDVESPDEYPCAISVSAFIFKIKGLDPLNEIEVEYLIRLENQMGC